MTMQITRLVELSLHYQIRELLSVQRTGEKVTSVDFLNYNLKYNNIITSYSVVVYKNGSTVTSGYVFDYINGVIKFSSKQLATDVITADYYYCPFYMYDEGSNETSDDFSYPAIAIYEHNSYADPYELGNTNNELVKTFIIEVWSERGGERTDATDLIVSWINNTFPIIDYNLNGFPYNPDGTLNTSFDPTNIVTYAFTDSINYRKGGSLDIGNKPKYFSEIYVDLKIFA
jgi:hypothetical protein